MTDASCTPEERSRRLDRARKIFETSQCFYEGLGLISALLSARPEPTGTEFFAALIEITQILETLGCPVTPFLMPTIHTNIKHHLPSEPHQVSEPGDHVKRPLADLVEYMWTHENLTSELRACSMDEVRRDHILMTLSIVEWSITGGTTQDCPPEGNPERLFYRRLTEEIKQLSDDDFEQLHATAQALAPRDLSPGRWRPIESAPKGRVPVLVKPGNGASPVQVGFYDFDRWLIPGAGGNLLATLDPTHWRPLPES